LHAFQKPLWLLEAAPILLVHAFFIFYLFCLFAFHLTTLSVSQFVFGGKVRRYVNYKLVAAEEGELLQHIEEAQNSCLNREIGYHV
jgi:hypothetical protein